MPKQKIDRVKLNQLLSAGKSQREVAQVFDVTEGAISKAKKELNLAVVKNVALENAHKVVGKNLDAVAQLQKINKAANQVLDELMGKEKVVQELAGTVKKILEGDPADKKEIHRLIKKIISDKYTALQACKTIESQLKLQLEIFQRLFDMKAIQEFQQEVLTTIGEASPEVRNAIISKLNQRRIIRRSIQLN